MRLSYITDHSQCSFLSITLLEWFWIDYLEHDLQLLALHDEQLDPLDELVAEEFPFDEKAKADIRRSTFESLHLGHETESILLREQSSSNSASHFVQ